MDDKDRFVLWSARVILLSCIWMMTLALLLDGFPSNQILMFVLGGLGIVITTDWYVRTRVLG